jgi:hypothetical protein
VLFAATVVVQDKLGAKNAWGFDLSAACSGFLYGLTVGNGKMGAMVWSANGVTMQVSGVDVSGGFFAAPRTHAAVERQFADRHHASLARQFERDGRPLLEMGEPRLWPAPQGEDSFHAQADDVRVVR